MWQRLTVMRIVISEFISLDGVVQAPGGAEEDTDGGFTHGGWSLPYFDEEVMGAAIDDVASRTEALLYGRRTWEVMAGAWPERAGDPFADWINAAPKYVASSTLDKDKVTWQPTTVIRPDELASTIGDLRHAPGRDVNVMGSATLVRWLLDNDLVDEMNLMIEPVILGGGKSIFPANGELRAFTLASAVTAKTGVQICRYVRAG